MLAATPVFTRRDEARAPASARIARAVDPRAGDPLAASPGLALQRCACGGGCPACRAKAAGLPALPIHPADDVYEREADRVADAVMRGGSAPSRTTAPAPPSISRLQRCSCGGSHAGGGLCPECAAKKREEEMQRSASGPSGPGVAPPIVHEVLRSPGEPLDAASRAFFEPRFGRGFGDVRVHTDARASESARAVQAIAYTVGSNLVFGAGAYRPGSVEGRRLLAHELTHVVQQGGAGPAVQRFGDLTAYPPGLPCPPATSNPGTATLSVIFGNDSSALTATATAQLNHFASGWAAMTTNPRVRIDGFASKPGSDLHNWKLSCARAMAVKSHLESPTGGAPAIPAGSMDLFTQGETDEFSTAGLGVDRRVTLVIPAIPPCGAVPPCPAAPPGTLPRNPGIASGSQCRGACGPDCPPTCTAQPNITICLSDPTGNCHVTCTYGGVIDCGSHQGCRDHDDCYDRCAASTGETDYCHQGGTCHCGCDIDCARAHGLGACNDWRQGLGPFDRTLRFTGPATRGSVTRGSCP